jgi:hypothetical protein
VPQHGVEHGPGDGPVGGDDRGRAVRVVAVEADHGVVVDDASGLEFVDLEVAAAQGDAEAAEFPVGFLDGASPQFGSFTQVASSIWCNAMVAAAIAALATIGVAYIAFSITGLSEAVTVAIVGISLTVIHGRPSSRS